MPTYGYRCPSCSLEFDVWQRMTDEPVAECPKCGTLAKRLFFPAGIVFKGSGFYKTDSRAASSSDGKPATGTDTAKKSDTASKPAPGSPSKPAAGGTESGSSSPSTGGS